VSVLLEQLSYEQDATVTDRLCLWLDDPRGHVFVADARRAVLGVVALYITPRFERTGWWAQVVALVTAEAARGMGVGRRLMNRAEAAAMDAGCDRIALSSSRERSGAHAFYRRLGYRDRCDDHAQFVRLLP
jgi:GNAT superfamily N-acetyltransferase